ncbi:MAG: sensor histidine kinase [Thermoguttaceae bacterium]
MTRRSIRQKFLFCLVLLLVLVLTIAGTGLFSLSLYSQVVSNIAWRSDVLPVSADLLSQVEELRITYREIQLFHRYRLRATTRMTPALESLPQQFSDKFVLEVNGFAVTLEKYMNFLSTRVNSEQENQLGQEWTTLCSISTIVKTVQTLTEEPGWILDGLTIEQIEEPLQNLRRLTGQLPAYQLVDLAQYSQTVRNRYRMLFSLFVLFGIGAGLMLALLIRLGYLWVFRPLSILIAGSRMIGSGQFQHRIDLQTADEMSELANALNDMTEKFETIRRDLDEKVRLRSQEVVRNEQLASVGFLAAGVAHEINNPLASIAMCAESLEQRLGRLWKSEDSNQAHDRDKEPGKRADSGLTTGQPKSAVRPESDVEVIRHYLEMIQKEAFRCKEITEKLLDFARTGQCSREPTDLKSLILGMVEMIAHHGKYREKEIRLNMPQSVYAHVNPQEIKQVVLNLLTNALDSIRPGGIVHVRLSEKDQLARIEIEDDGCGMDAETLKNVFEPFYTRKQQGQGTGLGLSITHRIVSDHLGRIEAESAGLGQGATFRVELPKNGE